MTTPRGAALAVSVVAGGLAAAALLGTAPIARADDGASGGAADWAAVATPPGVPTMFPDLQYGNTLTLDLGNQEDTFTTFYDSNSGLPVTTETEIGENAGIYNYGISDELGGNLYTTSLHDGYFFTSQFANALDFDNIGIAGATPGYEIASAPLEFTLGNL